MEKIAVYGSGTIGSCQATLVIGHGIPCVVIGYSESGLERCRKAIAQNWDDLITEGLATQANKTAAMKLLTISNDPAALDGCTQCNALIRIQRLTWLLACQLSYLILYRRNTCRTTYE